MSDRPHERPEEPIVAEPRGPEQPIQVEISAPIQVAPEPGSAPVMAEPEPRDDSTRPDEPEHRGPEPGSAPVMAEAEPRDDATRPDEPEHRGPDMSAPGEDSPSEQGPEQQPTDDTLALPPTTNVPVSAEPPPPSQPERHSSLEGTPVPFATPPTERNGTWFGLKLGFGIGGGVLLITAVAVALVVSLVTLTNSLMEKIEDEADGFMGAIADEQWDAAYDRLCPDLQESPVEDYVDEWDDWDAEGADVQRIYDRDVDTYALVELDDGSTVELRIAVAQDSETMDTTICGWQHSG